MNIFLHELKANGKSVTIWIVSMSLLLILFMMMFPSFSKEAEQFKKILEGYPQGLLKALGIPSDLFTILNFYCYIFLYITLCGSIQAMNIGLNIVSKESRNKTADFLLTKPVSRSAILTAKISAGMISIVITNIVFIAVGMVLMNTFKVEDFSMKIFIEISSVLFFLQTIFFTMGIFIATVAKKIKSVIATSLFLVFSFFILNIIESIIGDEALRYMTPFKYLIPTDIVKNLGYDNKFLLLGIAISCVFVILSYVIYNKKDIHAV